MKSKSSFSRTQPGTTHAHTPGLKTGPNGTTFISTGIPDLDKILGGGFALGSLVMVMEDAEAPHHLLLLRNFMSQGVIHNQPLLYASPSRDPRAFLGTLPCPIVSKEVKSASIDQEKEKGLKIAWQYKKYFVENQHGSENNRDTRKEYCNEFDLRKPLERHLLSTQRIGSISMQDSPNLSPLQERCSTFLDQIPRFVFLLSCLSPHHIFILANDLWNLQFFS
ncbi:hypothetical protein GIB67_012966 [Kingdonia uniflora]|uniref:Elongator complex protein 4 n=1 Tax=Kingdonia uniflora TaxID=39325 RepID=A0A7J7NFQ0_9MAGN|nr:hypothetical protein GIB67_012966 [Kingdonia uniflora]